MFNVCLTYLVTDGNGTAIRRICELEFTTIFLYLGALGMFPLHSFHNERYSLEDVEYHLKAINSIPSRGLIIIFPYQIQSKTGMERSTLPPAPFGRRVMKVIRMLRMFEARK